MIKRTVTGLAIIIGILLQAFAGIPSSASSEYLFSEGFDYDFTGIPDGWFAFSKASNSSVSKTVNDADNSYAVRLSNAGSLLSMGIVSETFDVLPGKEYSAFLDAKAISGVGRAMLLIYNASGEVISSVKQDTSVNGGWEQLRLDIAAGEFASKAAVLLYINEGINGDICFDNIKVGHGKEVALTGKGNLAYRRRITTNVKYQNGKWNWQKAVDGSFETKFEVNTSVIQESGYFTIDLGAVANINRVTLYEVGNKVSQFKIEVSKDNENWQTVAYCAEAGRKKNIDFPLVSARYVKTEIIKADGNFGFYEVEIFNTSDEETFPEGLPSKIPEVNTESSEVVENIPYASENFHIYLCIGQSNMVGGDDILWEDRGRTEGVYLLNSVGEWEYAQAGPGDMAGYSRYSNTTISNSDPTLGVAGMSPAQSFAMAMAKNVEENIGIGIVCQAVSGTSIDEWQKGAGTNLYESSVSRTLEALENGGVLKGILWAQGEACASRDDYLSLLNTFVTNLRRDLNVTAEEVPFIAAGYPITRAAQNETISKIASAVSNSDYIAYTGTDTFEGVHFTAVAQRIRGVRFAEKILEKVYGTEKTEQELYLEAFGEESPVPIVNNSTEAEPFTAGTGEAGNPYEITTVGHLYNIKNYPSAYYKQMNDINEPFRESISSFTGNYDGQGFSINLAIEEKGATTSGGFVRSLGAGGVLKNIVTKGSVRTSGGSAAGLAAVTVTTGAQIIDCVNYAEISGGARTGGIAGSVAKGTSVLRCKNFGNVSGEIYTGGVVGVNTLSSVSGCANYGNITGTTHLGGIVGQHNAAELGQCFNAGKIISSNELTGGIAGSIRSGNIINCYNVGEVGGSKPVGMGTFYVGTTSAVKNSYNMIDIPAYRTYGNISLSNPAQGVYQLKYLAAEELAGVTLLELSKMQKLTAKQLGDSEGKIWTEKTPFPTLINNVPYKTYGIYTVTFSSEGGGTADPSESINIRDGEVVAMNIAPYPGNIVESVKLNGVEISGVSAGIQTLYIPSISGNADIHTTFKSPALSVKTECIDGRYIIDFTGEAEGYNLYLYTGDIMPDAPVIRGVQSGTDITSFLTETTQYKAVVAFVENGREILFSAPAVVDASFGGGTGTKEEPYRISKIGHLLNIKKYPDKHFIQMNDIETELAEPLTPPDMNFSGVYDGNGKSLKINFNIRNGQTSTGVFSTVTNGTVKNLTVKGKMICHGANFGSITGKLSGSSQIINCVSEVEISVTNAGSVGGIVGMSNATSALIEGCINKGNISGYSYGLGGIIGNANAAVKINKCVNSGDVSDTRNVVGGIAGLCLTTVKNSYNLGNISGTTNAGGITGHHSGGTVAENCYNLGSVFATNADGKAAAFTTCNMAKTFSLKNCYNAGEIKGATENEKLIAYTAASGIVAYSNCYLLSFSENNESYGFTCVNREELKKASLGEGFTKADENNIYPYPAIKDNLQTVPWDFIKLTVNVSGEGSVDSVKEKYIKKGTAAPLNFIPESGYMAEYVRYKGTAVPLYSADAYSWKTPSLDEDSVINIVFSRKLNVPTVETFSLPFIDKTSENVNVAYVFAKAADCIEGYRRVSVGMLFARENIVSEEFNHESEKIKDAVCLSSTNSIGQYGVMFRGAGLKKGTYYVRPYSRFTDNSGNESVIYGEIISFDVE